MIAKTGLLSRTQVMRFFWIFLLVGFTPILSAADSLPQIEVTNIRRAYHNGEHNAFTDLIRWKGKFWLTFRSCPDGHMVHPTSSIRILCSSDTLEWKEVHRFSVPRRDTRDPHFLVFQDKLFVYTGTWWSGDDTLPREDYDLNKHLGYAVYSESGGSWSEPTQMEGTYGHYIWRAATHDGKAYLCARRKRNYSEQETGAGGASIVESAMLESEDGLNWRFHSLFQADRGNETAFLFEENGDLLSISRCGSDTAQLGTAAPPWTEKKIVDLPTYLGGPLLARWGSRYLVGGRRNTENGPKTALYWLVEETLSPIVQLPSSGDNSYPGFVELDDGSGLVSWYSSHEKNSEGESITAIYVANLTLEKP